MERASSSLPAISSTQDKRNVLIFGALTITLAGSALALWLSRRKRYFSSESESRGNALKMSSVDDEEVKLQDHHLEKVKKKKESAIDIACCGFDRPKEGSCSASVSLYHRHLFVCTGTSNWPKTTVSEDTEGFLELVTKRIKEKKSELKSNSIKITACDEPSKDPNGNDILLFPRSIRYRNLSLDQVPTLLNDLMQDKLVSTDLIVEPIHERYVFICSHMARDPRCGVCGPALVSNFNDQLSGKNVGVIVRKCSHVGGHKYAGNVLVFPSGDWFGYVTPSHVQSLLNYILSQHNTPKLDQDSLTKVELSDELKPLWRGRMGLSEEQQQAIIGKWNLPTTATSNSNSSNGSSATKTTSTSSEKSNGHT